MKHVLAIFFVLSVASAALASPVVGEQVVLRTGTSQYFPGTVASIVSGSTINLVAHTDGSTWADNGTPGYIPTRTFTSIALGTGVGQYQPTTIIADTVAAVGYALESYVDGLTPSYLALPAAPSSSGMTIGGSGVQIHATRPSLVVVRGTASMTSTLIGGQAYTVELRCDSNATPTTVVDDAAGSLNQALGLSVTLVDVQPWKLVTMARGGDYCRVVQSAGAATLALTGAPRQAL
jgi:hypothetical protein